MGNTENVRYPIEGLSDRRLAKLIVDLSTHMALQTARQSVKPDADYEEHHEANSKFMARLRAEMSKRADR